MGESPSIPSEFPQVGTWVGFEFLMLCRKALVMERRRHGDSRSVKKRGRVTLVTDFKGGYEWTAFMGYLEMISG